MPLPLDRPITVQAASSAATRPASGWSRASAILLRGLTRLEMTVQEEGEGSCP